MSISVMEITKLKERIERKQKDIAYLKQSLSKDKEELKKLETQYRLDEQNKKAEQDKYFLDLDCIPNMGLYNKLCKYPYLKCDLHNCMLSYDDVRNRKCIMKMCKHLVDI